MNTTPHIPTRLRRLWTSEHGWTSRAMIIVVLDILCVAAAYAAALFLRFDFVWSQIPAEYMANYRMLMPGTILLVVGILWVMRLYHSIWSFASVVELIRLVMSWIIIAVALPLISGLAGIQMPVSYWLVGDVLGFCATTGLRFSYRVLRIVHTLREGGERKSVMVVGAGQSGLSLIREIKGNPQLGLEVSCAIDDNPTKWGRYLVGVPVVGGRESIAEACETYDVDQIIFAIPSCDNATRKDILELCTATGLEVQTIPGMYQLVDGQVSVEKLRHVKLEDLLGREPIVVDAEEVRSAIEGKVVLVTGGGGSIGSELCRQVAKDNPKQLVIFDIYENNAYAIQQELRHDCPELNLVTLIGSVRDETRVREVFETYRPELVFHAAAHWRQEEVSHPLARNACNYLL